MITLMIMLLLAGCGKGAWPPEVELRKVMGDGMHGEAAMLWELRHSVERYRRVESRAAAIAGVRRMLVESPEKVLLYYENRLYVTRRHASIAKHKPHYFFSLLLSMAPFANFAALWDVGARGTECHTASPCLVIAKAAGYKAPGVLVPNPYFAHATEWDERTSAWGRVPFADRKKSVFWRGAVNQHCSSGNAARVDALIAAQDEPTLAGVRCTSFAPAAYCDVVKQHSGVTCGEFVDVANFSQWAYLLNLPGTMGGSYSRNLNYLWPQRSVVLLWAAPAVEWYYPALKDGQTHLSVDATTLAGVARNLVHSDAAALADAASVVFDSFLCGTCLQRYWRNVVAELRRHFRYDVALDDPDAIEAVLDGLDCDSLLHVRLGNWSSFYDDTHATAHTGHPCIYAPLDNADPLLRLCRRRPNITRTTRV